MTKRRYNIHVTVTNHDGQQTVKGWIYTEPLVDLQRDGGDDYRSHDLFADFVRSLADGSRKYLVLHNASYFTLAGTPASLSAGPAAGTTISIPWAIMAVSIFSSQLVIYTDDKVST